MNRRTRGLNALAGIGGFWTCLRVSCWRYWAEGLNALAGIGGFWTQVVPYSIPITKGS